MSQCFTACRHQGSLKIELQQTGLLQTDTPVLEARQVGRLAPLSFHYAHLHQQCDSLLLPGGTCLVNLVVDVEIVVYPQNPVAAVDCRVTAELLVSPRLMGGLGVQHCARPSYRIPASHAWEGGSA